MAAAEARAAWQRTANRCFVQEDAKRAPKIACCPPSSSKLLVDQTPPDVGNGFDQYRAHLLPRNWNPSNCNLSPDTKWWLLQPNYVNQRGLVFEQLQTPESDFQGVTPTNASPPSTFSEEVAHPNEDDFSSFRNISIPSSESLCRLSTTYLDNEIERRSLELDIENACHSLKDAVALSNNFKPEIISKETTNSKQIDDFDHLRLGHTESSSDISITLLTEKAGPWWRITDKYELASLVAQSSVRYIENCDLPQIYCADSGRTSINSYEGFDGEKLSSLLIDHKPCNACICSHMKGPPKNFSYGSTDGVQYLLRTSLDTEKSSRNFCEGTQESKGNPRSSHVCASKVQLLEALCHSQTRAREAEIAAQRAHSEKEHIIKLFLKQAMHLFAYKQWFQLLQLEAIYLQLKCKDNGMVPWDQLCALFPWLSARDDMHRARRNQKPKRDDRYMCGVGKFALAVAIGVGLAGAGLFLGWSLGWMLPSFSL